MAVGKREKRNLGVALAMLVLGSAATYAFDYFTDNGACAAFGREHLVKTRAWTLSEWDSCEYFDGEIWRDAQTDEPVR